MFSLSGDIKPDSKKLGQYLININVEDILKLFCSKANIFVEVFCEINDKYNNWNSTCEWWVIRQYLVIKVSLLEGNLILG